MMLAGGPGLSEIPPNQTNATLQRKARGTGNKETT